VAFASGYMKKLSLSKRTIILSGNLVFDTITLIIIFVTRKGKKFEFNNRFNVPFLIITE
jgi:hypothetical protein